MSKIEIRIDDTYSLCPDTVGYVLMKEIVSHRVKTNEEFLSKKVVGYFFTISDALRGYIRDMERTEMIEGNVSEIRDFLSILSRKEETLRENGCIAVKKAFEDAERAEE